MIFSNHLNNLTLKVIQIWICKLITFHFFKIKKLSLCHKLKFSNSYFFANWWRKPLIFQAYIIWSNRIHSFKYLRFTTLSCKDIQGVENQSLWQILNSFVSVSWRAWGWSCCCTGWSCYNQPRDAQLVKSVWLDSSCRNVHKSINLIFLEETF